MFTITARQLLSKPELFKDFSNDPEDSGWDETMARQWCEDYPQAVLNYDGTEWEVQGE